MRAPVRHTTHQGQQGPTKVIDHLNPAPEEEVAGGDGLSQDGDREVEVIEEGDSSDAEDEGARPRVLKAPRAPTQKEIDEHMATHLPHAAWCDICMKGRGRNTPHRGGAQRWARKAQEEEPEEESESEGAQEEKLHSGPVPRVSMDYFYLSKKETSGKKGAKAMSTKELQRKLRDLGKSDKGLQTGVGAKVREVRTAGGAGGAGCKQLHRASFS